MTKEKLLKQLYSNIYYKGELLNLSIKTSTIKLIETLFKDSYSRFCSFDDFINFGLIDVKNEVLRSPAIMFELKKQFTLKKALQPGVLIECDISQTIASLLGLNNFIDKNCNNVPQDILKEIMKSDFQSDFSSYRFLYFDDSHKIILFQCGGSNSIDAMFFKNGFGIKIEMKEDFARFGERDIDGYNEDGMLIYSENFKKLYPYYIPLIDFFNNSESAIKYNGNYNLNKILTPTTKTAVLNSIYRSKAVDLFLFALKKENKIYPVIQSELDSCCNCDTSEIRITGKNSKPVFTPNYLNSVLTSLNVTKINEFTIEFDYDQNGLTNGRGTKIASIYKINKHFRLKLEDCFIIGNRIQCNPRKIKQLKPNISLHIFVTRNIESERRTDAYFNEIGRR